jgi:nucleotide-binding universal stress UspA family protein
MGNILVLTDFSDHSLKAAKWAVYLAKKAHTNVLLLHSYIGAPVIPYDSSGQWLNPEEVVTFEEECRQSLSEFARRVEIEGQQNNAEDFRPGIQTEFAEGHLGAKVEEQIKKNDIELVIMAASAKTAFGRLLTGNKIGQVIERCSQPVLIVPEGSILQKLEKVTFAVNFDNNEIGAFHHLGHLSELFSFNIDVVHVIVADESIDDDSKQAFLKKLNNGNNIVRADYRAIRGKSVLPRLFRQCKTNGCDWLAITHHQYNFFQRLFYQSTTRIAIDNLKLPLLIFPSKGETTFPMTH